MKVSVLVLTFNEEINIGACLASLAWCDDVLVVDSGSTDATVRIAEEYGARVMRRPFDNCAMQRNFGLDEGALRHEWILHIDADEVLTPQFVAALESLQPPAGIDAWRVPSKTMLFGKWLRYAGMWPTYQVRLGHVQCLRFVHVGHGQRENLPPERVGEFPEAYLHYSFSHGLRSWLEKHVRYAKDEADAMATYQAQAGAVSRALGSGSATERRRAAKALAARLPLSLRPLARFVYIFFFRMGFRDGRAGLAYALMLSVYEGMISIFAYERLLSGDSNKQA